MFKLEFETDNAAFDNVDRIEIALRLNEIADAVKSGCNCGNIRDTNGNTIGTWVLNTD